MHLRVSCMMRADMRCSEQCSSASGSRTRPPTPATPSAQSAPRPREWRPQEPAAAQHRVRRCRAPSQHSRARTAGALQDAREAPPPAWPVASTSRAVPNKLCRAIPPHAGARHSLLRRASSRECAQCSSVLRDPKRRTENRRADGADGAERCQLVRGGAKQALLRDPRPVPRANRSLTRR